MQMAGRGATTGHPDYTLGTPMFTGVCPATIRGTYRRDPRMKKILELVLCILHPVAVVLIWINLAMRSDIGLIAKLTWGIASIVPFVPFVYVLTGNDFL